MSELRQNNPDVLRNNGKALSDAGEEARSVWERLKATSDGMGDIFGDDMVGGLIGAAYAAIYELADASFTSAADDYTALGERLVAVGDNDEETETDNAKILSRLHTKLEQIEGGR